MAQQKALTVSLFKSFNYLLANRVIEGVIKIGKRIRHKENIVLDKE